MKITDEVMSIIEMNQNKNISSQFFKDYQILMGKYNELIDKGIINKRQSQICTISDKFQLISSNSNYRRLKK